MKIEDILNEIKLIENDLESFNKELKNHQLLKSKLNKYIKEDKDSFKKIWKKYIVLFVKLKKIIKSLNYRKYFFFKNYNKLVLKKYALVLYFNTLVDLEKLFGKHERFIRVFLGENFYKDYGYFAKYIYRPSFINLINTPNIFIKVFGKFIKVNFLELLDSKKIDIKNTDRLNTDKKNLFFYIKYRFDKIIYYISKNVGYIISKTRFTNRIKGLITQKNIDKYLDIAKPGDILLTRGNWNASNISIPGFWKHMSMYIGKGSFIKNHFNFIKDLEDKTHYIIEATGKGVNIVEINKLLLNNDYLGVSRTKFKKEKILRTLKNSFKNIGKGYDHRFDYYSDKSLICSELIMKSYAKEFEGDVGIDIKLKQIGISLTYPPNKFVDLLVNGKENVKPIFFIDSIEKTGKNFLSTTYKFLKSRKRSRFSLFLK